MEEFGAAIRYHAQSTAEHKYVAAITAVGGRGVTLQPPHSATLLLTLFVGHKLTTACLMVPCARPTASACGLMHATRTDAFSLAGSAGV